MGCDELIFVMEYDFYVFKMLYLIRVSICIRGVVHCVSILIDTRKL